MTTQHTPLTFRYRVIGGLRKYFPEEGDKRGRAFLELLGAGGLSQSQIELLKDAGFDIIELPMPEVSDSLSRLGLRPYGSNGQVKPWPYPVQIRGEA